MGWLQDRIDRAIQDYHSTQNPARYLSYCRECQGAFWESHEIYEKPSYKQGFPTYGGKCYRCREEERPLNDLLEWTRANLAKVQALKDKLERGK